MILRRLMQHVKEQNWFSVGVELLVVILGIFMALQADAWYTNQQDRVKEKTLIRMLGEELTQSIKRLNETNQNLVTSRESAKEFLTALREGNRELALNNKWSLITVTRVPKIMINSPSYDEITENGRIDLILNKDIRDALYRIRQLNLTVTSVNSQINPQVVDIVAEIRKRVYYYGDSMSAVEYDFDTLRNDEIFINAFAYSIYLNNVMYIYNQRLIDELTATSEMLSTAH